MQRWIKDCVVGISLQIFGIPWRGIEYRRAVGRNNIERLIDRYLDAIPEHSAICHSLVHNQQLVTWISDVDIHDYTRQLHNHKVTGITYNTSLAYPSSAHANRAQLADEPVPWQPASQVYLPFVSMMHSKCMYSCYPQNLGSPGGRFALCSNHPSSLKWWAVLPSQIA